jgi:apolipoprotein N-acyltransferase
MGYLWAFHWAPHALELSLSAPWWLSLGLFLALCAWESLMLGIFSGLLSHAAERGVQGLYLAPFLWVTGEYWWPKIMPWNMGATQLDCLHLVQIASLTGTHGISFVLVLVTAIPTAIELAARQSTSLSGTRVPEPAGSTHLACAGFIASGIGLLALTLGYSFYALQKWESSEAKLPHLLIAVVQVNNSQAESELRLRERTLALDKGVELVCWPESSLGTYCTDLSCFSDKDQVAQLSRESFQSLRPTENCSVDILAGGRTFQPQAPEVGPYRMTAFLIDPQERIRGTYHKRTLLPFGEYIPGQQFIPGLREWATLSDLTEPGESAHCLETSGGVKLGTVICYEDLFSENSRHLAQNGAEVLISLINDYRFEHPLTLKQHGRLANMRAVENGRYFLRSSTTGVTCITSPTGEIMAQLPLLSEGALVHNVALVKEQTLFTRYGDWFPYLCTVASVLGVYFVARTRSAKETQ